MDDRLHQQALGIDEQVPFLAFDLLACIKARRVNRVSYAGSWVMAE
jgi:hypothetical protein